MLKPMRGSIVHTPATDRVRPSHPAAGGAALLALAAAPALAAGPEAYFETAGRTHIALVHFPIALVFAALGFEAFRIATRRHRPSAGALGCLFIAALGGAAAVVTGWWHADFIGRAGENEVELHRWIAIAGTSLTLAALGLGLAALRADRPTLRRLYVLFLTLATGTVAVVGHLGGELVYGEGYILGSLLGDASAAGSTVPDPVTDDRPLPQTVNFETDLLPIFEANCIACHGVKKQNGKLRLDSLEALRAGPYYHDVVVAGDSARSAIYQRVTLPPRDHDFMPRRGDPLSARQVAAIARWIDALPPDNEPPEPETIAPPPAETAALESEGRAAIAAVAQRGAFAAFESAQSERLIVNFGVLSRPVTRDDLAVLMPVADRVIELNLGGVGATDALLPDLAAFTALERLNLSRSEIHGPALAPLTALKNLRVLNLYGSSVASDAVDTIAALPALERVYLWSTAIDEAGIDRLRHARPGLEVIAGARVVEPEPTAEPAPPSDPPAENAADDSADAPGGG
jgi:uncharacterized membrane protein